MISTMHRFMLCYHAIICYEWACQNQEKNQTELEDRRSLRRIIVVLDNIVEYNGVRELADFKIS